MAVHGPWCWHPACSKECISQWSCSRLQRQGEPVIQEMCASGFLFIETEKFKIRLNLFLDIVSFKNWKPHFSEQRPSKSRFFAPCAPWTYKRAMKALIPATIMSHELHPSCQCASAAVPNVLQHAVVNKAQESCGRILHSWLWSGTGLSLDV